VRWLKLTTISQREASLEDVELAGFSTGRLKLRRDKKMWSTLKIVGKTFSTRKILVERNEREGTIARAAWMLSEEVPRERFNQ